MGNRQTLPRSQRPYHLSPSLLSADTAELGKAAKLVEEAGGDSLHIDVMDGHYVKNFAFSPKTVADLARKTVLPLHVHLETEDPDGCIPLFQHAHMIIIQEDTSYDLERSLDLLLPNRQEAGVGLNPDRPVERLFPVLHRIRLALVMAVEPGFGGQPFDPKALDKVKILVRERDRMNGNFQIGIDGGLNSLTIVPARRVGCEYFVIGSGIFGSDHNHRMAEDPVGRMNHLNHLIRDSRRL